MLHNLSDRPDFFYLKNIIKKGLGNTYGIWILVFIKQAGVLDLRLNVQPADDCVEIPILPCQLGSFFHLLPGNFLGLSDLDGCADIAAVRFESGFIVPEHLDDVKTVIICADQTDFSRFH